MTNATRIHWARIVLGALLLEAVLFLVLVPISFVNMTVFFVAAPIGCFAFGYLVTRWLLRKVTSQIVLHGVLVGVIATGMYFALVIPQPGGISAAVAVYGAPLFWFSQAMRIAGCVAGAAHQRQRARVVLPSAPGHSTKEQV